MHPRILFLAFALVATATSSSVVAAQTDSTVDASVDDEGNVAASTQGLQGATNAASNTACASCSTAGSSSRTPPLGVVGGLLALGAVLYGRRRD